MSTGYWTSWSNVDNIHFDEAWFAYAAFHPLYRGYYAMTPESRERPHPPVFATQSTHKLLAALSQASMIHVLNGSSEEVDRELFNEAFMMHSSTSPQYSIIATLDVSTRMMKGSGGPNTDERDHRGTHRFQEENGSDRKGRSRRPHRNRARVVVQGVAAGQDRGKG